MKKKAGNLVICIIFLAGLSLLLYPFVANQWNNYRQKQLISGYEQVVSEKEAAEGIDYDAERKKAEDYNEALLPCVLPDSFALAESSGVDPVYMNTLNIAGDEMMGSVEIPKINIKIPIYHTTEEEVLNKGAGHLEGSSLPVGGANTHAVISAHRGLPSASLFTDLDQMKPGDHFLLHVLDETLCYEVDKISVVKPEGYDCSCSGRWAGLSNSFNLYSLWSKYRTTSGSWSQSTLCRRGSQRREDSAQWKQSSHKLSSLGICWSIRYRTLYFCVILKGNKAEEASE